MTDPLTPADQAAATASAIVENADALGLTWRLRPATIVAGAQMVVDGDTESIDWTDTLIGPVQRDQRVWVITVPPSGNYIVGSAPFPMLPGVAACRTAAQALPTGVATLVSWDSSSTNTSGYLPTTFGTTITVPTGYDGVHSITVSMGINASGARNFITILKNGNPTVRASMSAGEALVGATAVLYLAAGDTITVDAFQNSGGPTTMSGCLEMYRLSQF